MSMRLVLGVAIMFSAFGVGCGEVGMNLTATLKVADDVVSNNRDVDSASACVYEYDTSVHEVDGEYVDTIQIEVGRDCITEVISDINEGLQAAEKEDPE